MIKNPRDVFSQIQTLTSDLISISLCVNQKFPAIVESPEGFVDVTVSNLANLSVSLKNIPYHEIYKELASGGLYNLKMVDGALIQMMYRFKKDELVSHRLAFFPSPDLSEYQNNSDIYEEDEIYAEVVAKNIVSTPIRFDFDPKRFEEIHHPRSHLTLGQYVNCRIPVGAPLTPFVFLDFILRSFYNTAHRKFCSTLTNFGERFPLSIVKNEQMVLHVMPGV